MTRKTTPKDTEAPAAGPADKGKGTEPSTGAATAAATPAVAPAGETVVSPATDPALVAPAPPLGPPRAGPLDAAPATDPGSGAAFAVPEAGQDAATRGPAPDDPAVAGPVLVVTGPAIGFRRAGRSFGPAPVRIPLTELTPEQILALRSEPMLVTGVEED